MSEQTKYINLDMILGEKKETVKDQVIVIQEAITPIAPTRIVDWDSILNEVCYKLPKGYPTVVDGVFTEREEIIIINEALEAEGLPTLPLPKQLIKETVTDGSTQAEKALEILLNKKKELNTKLKVQSFLKTKKDDIDAKFLTDYYDKYLTKDGIPAAEKYYLAMSLLPDVTKATKLGSTSYITTKEWAKLGGLKGKVTSKTDIRTFSANNNFSVKNGSTQVRVLDASAPQLTALINHSISVTGYDDEIITVVAKNIERIKKLYASSEAILPRLYKGEKYGIGQLRKITDKRLQKTIEDFDKNTKQLSVAINTIFEKVAIDPSFKKAFILESLTGKAMFGKTSEGCASAILTFSSDFTKIAVKTMPAVVDSITSNFTIPKFGTKSSGARIGKTAQLSYSAKPKKEKTLKENISEYFNLCDRANKLVILENRLLNKKALLESNYFQTAWDKIKQTGGDLYNKLLELVSNIYNQFKDFIVGLGEALMESYHKAMEFIGINLVFEQAPQEMASITYDDL